MSQKVVRGVGLYTVGL